MASITIETCDLEVVYDSNHERAWNMRVEMCDTWYDDNIGGYHGITIRDIFVKRVVEIKLHIHDGTQEVQGYVLHPGEEHKLPNPLPRGVILRDGTDEGDGACKVLLPDWEWITSYIARQCIELYPFEHTPSDRAEIWCRSWTRIRSRMARVIAATFDLRCADDRYTKFDRPDRYHRVFIRDSDNPYLTPRQTGYSDGLSDYGIGGQEQEWNKEADIAYREDMDENLKGTALARFRKAFGSTLRSDTGQEHRFKGRKLTLVEDQTVPFPDECKFTGFALDTPLVALEIDRAGRYRKPLDTTFFTRDCVFIHREGTYTRFLFWEHRHMAKQVGDKIKFTVLYPVVVADAECKKYLPISPMRGMDPRITKAIAGNPYLASALQHAINRRKFLQSQLPAEPKEVFDLPGVPVLIRSGTDVRLRPNRYSKAGRQAMRTNMFRADTQSLDAFQSLGPNDFEFGAVVQRVAVPAPRRALQLDM